VLAIAAAALGFAPVSGVDNELESVQAAAQNAAVNGVAIEVAPLDLRSDPLPSAPVIVANLLAPLLLELAERITDPPGILIASGLLTEQADGVAAAFATRHGLNERRRVTIGDWSSLLLARA
jgi:ribosomal protein L11 methyltransferase